MLRFDTKRLRADLEQLPPKLRGVFAALCARRLVLAYTEYGARSPRANVQRFTELHELLWQCLTSDGAQVADVEAAAEEALGLLPPDEPLEPYAEDAAAALAYAIRATAGEDPQDALWAAQRVYGALDSFVQEQGLDLTAPGGEEAILGHALVQAELGRQAADLAALRSIDDAKGGSAGLAILRARADDAAACLFG